MLCEPKSQVHLKLIANKTISINHIYSFLVYTSLPFESNFKNSGNNLKNLHFL